MEGQTRKIPIFPLSNVVLFPRVQTPLHIFEKRYRQMTEAALAGDQRIVMAVIRPDFVGDVAGDPPVFEIACIGVIAESKHLADGRFHILLHGEERVRILDEDTRPSGQLYRSAHVLPLADPCPSEDADQIAAMRLQASQLVRDLHGEQGQPDPLRSIRDIDDAAFVNSLCNALPLSVPEKQGLLEVDGIPGRYQQLIEILEFATAERKSRRVPNSSVLH